MVTCSSADAADRLIRRQPLFSGDVLSPAAAAFDRGDKLAAYRQLPSLAELLPVDVDRQRCDPHRKGADGLWVLHLSGPGQGAHLASVELAVAAEVLWAELEPPEH